MKKQKFFVRFIAILLVLAMLAGSGFYLVYMIAPAEFNVYASSDDDAYAQLDNLKDVIKTIQDSYRDKLTTQELVDAAYKGVFDVLDPWSEYYPTQEEEDAFWNVLNNQKYVGVGLTISVNKDGDCVISSVNPRGSGYEQGIKPNDIITKVGGQSVSGWTATAIASALRGTKGTKVTVEIRRGNSLFTVTLERRELTILPTSCKMLDGTVGYIDIDNFNEGTADSLYESCLDLLSMGADRFVIDLRDNGGGYMDEALESAALFLHEGDEMLSYVKQGEEIEAYTLVIEEPLIMDHKVVLLINENTASAAEAFALMLRDNNAATLVGTTSYGKGVFQLVYSGVNGSSFKLSTGYFYGPNKVSFDGVGIQPDYIVYNGSGMTTEDAKLVESGCVPMTEGKKYQKKYSYGLNVLAAQQRLNVLGYNVTANGILTGETMQALCQVQKDGGASPYGGLDFTTMNILENMFQAYLYGTGDAQLAKAVELINK